LKPIRLNKLVIAAPLATVAAVDIMHVKADDLYCLSVVEGNLKTDHYYDTQDVPNHATVVEVVQQLIKKWQ
jgi:predicted phosphoribosyltransferase